MYDVVMITGQRPWDNWELMDKVLRKANPKTMINGEAVGADQMAAGWMANVGNAEELLTLDFTVKQIVAPQADLILMPVTSRHWNELGKSAGHRRNRAMLDMLDLYYDLGAKCALLGFLDVAQYGPSRGTAGCLEIARREYSHVDIWEFPKQLVRPK